MMKFNTWIGTASAALISVTLGILTNVIASTSAPLWMIGALSKWGLFGIFFAFLAITSTPQLVSLWKRAPATPPISRLHLAIRHELENRDALAPENYNIIAELPWTEKNQLLSVAELIKLVQRNSGLIIIGPAGSGKSTLLLRMAYSVAVQHEKPSEDSARPSLMVPFLMASWDPRSERLIDWMRARLEENFALDPIAARDLVTSRSFTPLLDGFDEIDSRHSSLVIDELRAFFRDGHMAVVATRSSHNSESLSTLNLPILQIHAHSFDDSGHENTVQPSDSEPNLRAAVEALPVIARRVLVAMRIGVSYNLAQIASRAKVTISEAELAVALLAEMKIVERDHQVAQGPRYVRAHEFSDILRNERDTA